jgi:hypothetical protein
MGFHGDGARLEGRDHFVVGSLDFDALATTEKQAATGAKLLVVFELDDRDHGFGVNLAKAVVEVGEFDTVHGRSPW